MTRREFVARTAAAVVGVALAPIAGLVPTPALSVRERLNKIANNRRVGETMRVRLPQRYDVVFGWSTCAPEWACRVSG